MPNIGVQRYRYIPGIVEIWSDRTCKPNCETVKLTAQGDRYFTLSGRDLAAEKNREAGYVADTEGPDD